MLTGEVKQRLIDVLSEIVDRHQRARAAVTEEVETPFLSLVLFFSFFFSLLLLFKISVDLLNVYLIFESQ